MSWFSSFFKICHISTLKLQAVYKIEHIWPCPIKMTFLWIFHRLLLQASRLHVLSKVTYVLFKICQRAAKNALFKTIFFSFLKHIKKSLHELWVASRHLQENLNKNSWKFTNIQNVKIEKKKNQCWTLKILSLRDKKCWVEWSNFSI